MAITSDGLTHYGYLDPTTSQDVQYRAATKWWDGSPLTDAKCDGVLYRKTLEGAYVKRVYHGSINALWLGLKPDHHPALGVQGTDNWGLLQGFLNQMPPGTITDLVFPDGNYYFSKSLVVNKGRGINFAGESELVPYQREDPTGPMATLTFAPNTGGISILDAGSENGVPYDRALCSTVRNLKIKGSHATVNDKGASGIYHTVICFFENVWCEGFQNAGFYTFASVSAPSFSNASFSRYIGCRATHNLEGFYIGGPDSNASMYMNCIAVENRRWGFLDNGFLGNFFWGCQSATNGRVSESLPADQGGGFCILGPSGYSAVRDCYSETDQLPNYINPQNSVAIVSGGLHGNGWCGNAPGEAYKKPGGFVQQGPRVNELRVGGAVLGDNGIDFNLLAIKTKQAYQENPRVGLFNTGWDGGSETFWEAVVRDVKAGRIGPASFPAFRSIPASSLVLNATRWIGARLEHEGTPATLLNAPYQVKDVLHTPPATWTPALPRTYTCVKAGRPHPHAGLPVTYLTTDGEETGTITLANLADYGKLVDGDWIQVQGMGTGNLAQVVQVTAQQGLLVNIPAGMSISPGKRINWMYGYADELLPTAYTGTTILLDLPTRPTTTYTVGQTVRVSAGDTTIRAIREENGLLFLDINQNPQIGYVVSPGTRVEFESRPMTPWAYFADYFTLAFPTEKLKAGDTVAVNDVRTTVQAIGSPRLYVSPRIGHSPTMNGSATLFIQKPVFQADGEGVGTLAERPNMTGHAPGYRYYATDQPAGARRSFWNGTDYEADV